MTGAPDSDFHVLVARLAGRDAATAMAFDHEGDCGVFNMGTLEPARRRGLGTAIAGRHLHDAAERGCRTASLQSTPTAERVYASAGFRDLGGSWSSSPGPRPQRCSGLGKSNRAPASHSERWLPCAGIPPASLSMRAMWSMFQVAKVVLRLVKSFSGPPDPGSR